MKIINKVIFKWIVITIHNNHMIHMVINNQLSDLLMHLI